MSTQAKHLGHTEGEKRNSERKGTQLDVDESILSTVLLQQLQCLVNQVTKVQTSSLTVLDSVARIACQRKGGSIPSDPSQSHHKEKRGETIKKRIRSGGPNPQFLFFKRFSTGRIWR